jgi:hypothetical protein
MAVSLRVQAVYAVVEKMGSQKMAEISEKECNC